VRGNSILSREGRWQELLHDLDLKQPKSCEVKISRGFVTEMMKDVAKRDPEAAGAVCFYYGLYGELAPQRIATIASWLNFSKNWISGLKRRGLNILRGEIAAYQKALERHKAKTPEKAASVSSAPTGIRVALLDEFFSKEFIRKRLEDMSIDPDSSLGKLLYGPTIQTRVQKRLPAALTHHLGRAPLVDDLRKLSPTEIRQLANLGEKGIRWVEEYLYLFGIVLPETKTVYGMRPEVRRALGMPTSNTVH